MLLDGSVFLTVQYHLIPQDVAVPTCLSNDVLCTNEAVIYSYVGRIEIRNYSSLEGLLFSAVFVREKELVNSIAVTCFINIITLLLVFFFIVNSNLPYSYYRSHVFS
jgi:hypothetical protein